MPFNFLVTRTVNGKTGTVTIRDIPDSDRAWHEDLIAKFDSGDFPAEHILSLSAGGSGPDSPDWARSWRWADIKALRIEDAS